MADQSPELLRDTPTNVVTSQDPRSSISAGQIEAPFKDVSALLGKFGQDASDLAVTLAQRQATADLANQKVVRGPDGQPQVLNPASAMIFGDAGRAYAHAVQSGTADQILASVRPDLAQIHANNPLDPQAVAKGNDAYLTKLSATTAGMGPAGEQVMRSARDMASQHQDMATTAGATNTMENTKKAILATVEDRKNALTALAATPGGPNKQEWEQALSGYDEALGKLGSSPLYKMPPEMLAMQRKNFMGELQGQQLVASVDSTFNKKGKAEAQQELMKLYENKDISREQASLLYRQGMSHLEYLSADQTAAQKAAAQSVGIIQTGLANGKLDPNDPTIAGMREQARAAGSADTVNQIDALLIAARAHRAVASLPASQQAGALGDPAGGPGNDYYAITRKLESGGNDNAVSRNPTTGAPIAFGRYQFTAGTWRGLGEAHPELGLTGENILDPNKQEAAIRAFTGDNAKILTSQGMDVTPANLRMMAFLGARGGPQFLKTMQANPDAPAAATFPREAQANPTIFYANGQPRTMAQVYGLMTKAVGGAQVSQAPVSANGVPFSDADAAKNPWLRVEYLRSIAEAPATRQQAFSEYETGSSATLKAGNPLTDDTVKGLIQTAQGDPTKETKAAELVGMNVALKAIQGGGGGGAPMTQAQITQATQEAFAAARDAPDHLHQVMATSMYNYMKEQGEWAEKHPLDDAARRYKQATPPPIDPGNPGALPDNIAYRGALAQHYAAVNGSPTPSIFNSEELPQIKGILANPDPAAKAQVYGAIANLPEAVRSATLKALGGDNPKDMAQAAAGSLMRTAPDVAQSIFRGQGIMDTDKRFDPEGEGQQKAAYKTALDGVLPRNLFSEQDLSHKTGAYATTEQMVKARYADLVSQASPNPPAALQADVLKKAVDDVTGGVLSHNGGPLIAPARGMTQDRLDATVRGVTDSDLQGAMTLKGERVTSDYLQSTATLESAGDGKYFVKLDGNPLKPVYAYAQPQLPPNGDGKWSKFVLDLRNVKPSTDAAPVNIPAFTGSQ